MAIVHNNIVVDGLRGLLGKRLFARRDKVGRTILCASPKFDPRRPLSEQQKAHHVAFREAAAYALSAKDRPIYARLAAGTPLNPYNVAIADWFHPPQILDVDLGSWRGGPRELIRIRACDDVLVEQVTVSITDEFGTLLEHGPATRIDDQLWHYTTSSTALGTLKVLVSAQDLPGHVTQFVKPLA